MTVQLAELLVIAVALYAGLGLLVSAAFMAVGAPRTDPAARGMAWPTRCLLVPGAAALWPWVLFKWVAGRPPPLQ